MSQEHAEIFTANESKRLLTLHRYKILDTPPEEAFDRITRLAAHLLSVPVALVSLVDYDRIWFKSQYGVNLPETARHPGLCASAILSESVYCVDDAPNDPRAFANALVTGEHKFRFYAAAPLRTREGYNLGVVAVADRKPRTLDAHEKEILETLAGIVMDEIELRLAARNAVKRHKDLLNTAAHDLKNPLLSILGFADEITEESDSAEVASMAGIIKRSSAQMLDIVNELLQLARVENGVIRLSRRPVDLAELADAVVEENTSLAGNKEQTICRSGTGSAIAAVDVSRTREILDNLISNAVKYSPIGGEIQVSVRGEESAVTIAVKDFGPGFSQEESDLLFEKFGRLKSKPTAGESTTGLGLAIARALTQLHGGTIWAESEGEGKGSTFYVEFPRRAGDCAPGAQEAAARSTTD